MLDVISRGDELTASGACMGTPGVLGASGPRQGVCVCVQVQHGRVHVGVRCVRGFRSSCWRVVWLIKGAAFGARRGVRVSERDAGTNGASGV